MPITSFFFFKRNDAGHNLEDVVPVVADSLLSLDGSLATVFLPKSNFATAAQLTTHLVDVANPHSVTKVQVGLGNVTNVAQVAASEKGAASGVATLDGGGKIPTGQLPAAVVGGMNYQAAWNASTNSPAIPTAAVGNKGWYYRVSVAGATSIGGITDWEVGDWVVSNGTAWEKIDNTDKVLSVAGRAGDVALVIADIGGLVSVLDTVEAGLGNIDTKEPLLGSPGANNSVLFSSAAGVRAWMAPAAALAALGGVASSLLGANSGVATLDSGGKVPVAQIPLSVLGGLNYQNTWNATTNSPAIPTADGGNKGWYYVVATAGATSISGIIDWQVGDWLVSNGASWTKIDNTDLVLSVAGRTGAVVLVMTDVTDITPAGRALLDDDSAFSQRETLEVGGRRQLSTWTPSVAAVLDLPVGIYYAGDQVKTYITPGADVNFKLNAAMRVPSSSSFNNAVGITLTSGKLYIVQIEYDATHWNLTTIIGGY